MEPVHLHCFSAQCQHEEHEDNDYIMVSNIEFGISIDAQHPVDHVSNACIMLGLPGELSLEQFKTFVEPYLAEISSFNILVERDDVEKFPVESKTPPCLVVPLGTIILNRKYDVHLNSLLPLCVVCLRRIRESTSRIDGVNEIPVSSSFIGNGERCKICRIYGGVRGRQPKTRRKTCSTVESTEQSAQECGDDVGISKRGGEEVIDVDLDSLRRCTYCGLGENIWVCLHCSHTGCGRYTAQHAQHHFEQSRHPYSLELATGRIWDYLHDDFVHDVAPLLGAAAGVHGDWVGPGGRAGATATGCSGSSASGPSDEGDAESSVQGFGCSGHVGRLASEEGPPSSPAYNRQQHYSLSSLGSHGGASGGSLGSAGPDSPRQADSWDDPTVAKWALAGGRAPRSNSVGFHVAANQYLYGSGLELGTRDKLGCLVQQYEGLLESQLVEQQMFFEKKLARETLLAIERSLRDAAVATGSRSGEVGREGQATATGGARGASTKAKPALPSSHSSAASATSSTGIGGATGSPEDDMSAIALSGLVTEEDWAVITDHKIAISAQEYECSQVLAALRETEAQTRRARKQNEGLLKEQKALRQRVAALVEAQEQLKRDSEIEISELEQQIRDLSFYTRTRSQVEASPMKGELQGSQVVLSPGQFDAAAGGDGTGGTNPKKKKTGKKTSGGGK